MKKEDAAEIRCAIIGIGVMGSKYALMLNQGEIEGLSLAAVCCRSDERAAWAAANLSDSVRICRSEDALYEHADEFEAVLVVTPHKQHPAMAIRAFEAGKHVLSDKPAGTDAADAQAMYDAALRTGKVYALMCHQRAYPQHIKLKELLDEKVIGRITRVLLENTQYFRTRYYHHSGSWRSSWTGEGGGLLINQGHHLIDLWNWLFGMPQTIYADIPFGKYNDFSVDDEATLIMEYPDKVTGTFFLTTGEGAYTDRLEIAGTKGRILMEGSRITLTLFSQDLEEYSREARVTSRQELSETEEVFTFPSPDQAYQVMLRNFAGAILRGEALIAPGSAGIEDLEIINAAYLSAFTGTKVTLPADMKQYRQEMAERQKREAEARPK